MEATTTTTLTLTDAEILDMVKKQFEYTIRRNDRAIKDIQKCKLSNKAIRIIDRVAGYYREIAHRELVIDFTTEILAKYIKGTVEETIAAMNDHAKCIEGLIMGSSGPEVQDTEGAVTSSARIKIHYEIIAAVEFMNEHIWRL